MLRQVTLCNIWTLLDPKIREGQHSMLSTLALAAGSSSRTRLESLNVQHLHSLPSCFRLALPSVSGRRLTGEQLCSPKATGTAGRRDSTARCASVACDRQTDLLHAFAGPDQGSVLW
jgi:hypothetical protein